MAIGTVNIKLDSGPHTQLWSPWMSGQHWLSCGLWRCSYHAITLRTQRRWACSKGGRLLREERGCPQPTPFGAQLHTPAQEGPWHPYRQRGRLQLQHLIPRLWGVLKFCVVFPLLDFGKVSPSLVPLLWARPLARDLDKSTDCHSCSHRGTIKHLLKSTKYLHPKNKIFLPICNQNHTLLGLGCHNPAQD